MILDNENSNDKVYKCIEKNVTDGLLNIVTGYFSLGALAYLIPKINEKISVFNLVLGDFIPSETDKISSLDLINEELNFDSAFNASSTAKCVVDFLKQKKVTVKTLEPNFCHAKAYIYESKDNSPMTNFYIFGSSNLTEAGIGLRKNNNIELNMVGTGTASEYREIYDWFRGNIWSSPKARDSIKVGSREISFKQYLINEIEKIFQKYSPKDVYFKMLYHLWGARVLPEMADPNFNRQIGRLENTIVYNTLYEFQQKGVLSLIKMLQQYNGAILADAVGLGKTWTALSVIKFFEFEGYQTVLICPKKLQQNWEQFLEVGHRFFPDNYKYKIRYHTDLTENLWNRYRGSNSLPLSIINDDTPKLIVIDESHNLRNDKSQRYKWLVKNILKECKGDIKVLMLSATPINNSLLDIRNQFKLIVRDDPKGFEDTIGIRNVDYTFKNAQTAFNEWRKEPGRTISSFIKKISDSDFFRLTDSLTVARTREMVLTIAKDLKFPRKEAPVNIRKTPKQIGNFDSFEELFEKFPPMLSAYQPAFYLPDEGDIEVIHDEKQRDFFLVKMMYILMVKRLESSWQSFKSTVEKIAEHHQNALNKINEYENYKNEITLDSESQVSMFDEDDEAESEFEELTLGKKRKIKLSDIDKAGKLAKFKADIKIDLTALDNLTSNLKRFEEDINKELSISNNQKSKDEKLEALIKLIVNKRKTGINNNNSKVLIFTVFRDTALYLYNQLKSRGFDRIAMVSGTDSRSSYSDSVQKKFEGLLEQFAPYTKLFNEKEWRGFNPSLDLTKHEKFMEWRKWIAVNHPDYKKQLDNPIDILIATDCLSEGQNLQDCDFVMNYDIHWNPVRVLQRCGRIDRLASPNEIIFSANFWPTDNINNYLNLESRIEDRMIAMKLAGAEVDKSFTDKLRDKIDSDKLDRIQTNRMLEQLETSWDDINRSNDTIGFDILSLETFRQDLVNELLANKGKYETMPLAIFSGFIANRAEFAKKGMVALLGYPSRPSNVKTHTYKSYDLVYIDKNGSQVLSNQQEILSALIKYKDAPRDDAGLENIDKGDIGTIKDLSDSLKAWFKNKTSTVIENEDGSKTETLGQDQLDFINDLKKGKKAALDSFKEEELIENKFQPSNYDLIAWMIINLED